MKFPRGFTRENMLQKQRMDSHYIPQQSFKSILDTTALCLDTLGQYEFSSDYLALLKSYREPGLNPWAGKDKWGNLQGIKDSVSYKPTLILIWENLKALHLKFCLLSF